MPASLIHRRVGRLSRHTLAVGAAVLFFAVPGTRRLQADDRALVLADTAYIDFGNRGDDFDLLAGRERTFALWLHTEQSEYHTKILTNRPVERFRSGFSLFVHQHAGTLGLWLTRSDIELSYGNAGIRPIADGEWHHVALVQRNGLLLGYVDAHLEWTIVIDGAADEYANDQGLWLGWNGTDIVRFTGQVDELTIWHRALTLREIRQLMFAPAPPDTAGLVAYWSFDEQDGAPVIDRSGNEYHGRLHGPALRVAATRPTVPPFTETWWFYALCGLAGLGVLYLLMRLYALLIDNQRRHLEKVVAARTEEVERQKEHIARQSEDLTKLDRAKGRFFGNISHEFRTPLTLALGSLEDILSGRYGDYPSTMREPIDLSLLSNRRLLRMVDQLLDVVKLEADTLTLCVRPTNLSAFLGGIAQAFKPVAERRRITFTHDISNRPLIVHIDPDRFEQIITNLLSNAFKFTQSGGRVHLELRDEGHPVIEVRDNGPGIPPDKLPFVFERFFRADEARTTPGSGIGLSLVKELAERHGARVHVESHSGFGSVFSVHLQSGAAHFDGRADVVMEDGVNGSADVPDPLRQNKSFELSPNGIGSRDEKTFSQVSVPDEADDDRTTVLVVDDNAEIRAYVYQHLKDEYRVVEAEDGEDALARIREATPDLILSDVTMPRLDGLGLLREVRLSAETDFVPVILLTARAGVEARVEGISAGADDYLEKPFSVEELRASVRNLILQRKRLRLRYAQSAGMHPAVLVEDMASADGVFVDRLRAIVAERLEDANFDIDALAAAVAIDRSNLYRRMTELTGQAPSVYLKLARLERAAALLSARAGSVSEIAYASGFRSVAHFSRSFAEQFGRSPSAYAGERPS